MSTSTPITQALSLSHSLELATQQLIPTLPCSMMIKFIQVGLILGLVIIIKLMLLRAFITIFTIFTRLVWPSSVRFPLLEFQEVFVDFTRLIVQSTTNTIVRKTMPSMVAPSSCSFAPISDLERVRAFKSLITTTKSAYHQQSWHTREFFLFSRYRQAISILLYKLDWEPLLCIANVQM